MIGQKNIFSKRNVYLLVDFLLGIIILFFDMPYKGYALSYALIFNMVVLLLYSSKAEKAVVKRISGQILPFEICLMMFWILNIWDLGRVENWNIILIEAVGVFCIFLNIFCHVNSLINKECLQTLINYLRHNWGILLIVLLYIVGSLPTIFSLASNDSTIYYQGIKIAREQWNFYDYSAYNLGNHSGFAYCFFLVIGDIVFGDFGIGGILVNICLGVSAILAFNGIVDRIFNKLTHIERILVCSVFAFSPYLFGLVGEINLEFPQLCFLTWLFYSQLSDKKILQFISGFCLVFTKETGVLIFAGYYVGLFIADIIKSRKKSIPIKESIFLSVRSYFKFAILSGMIWVYIFICLSSKLYSFSDTSGYTDNLPEINGHRMDALGIWFKFILYKFEELFLFNWNWLIWGMIIVLILLYRKKIKEKCDAITIEVKGAFIGAFLVFLFTQLFFITWTNVRYQLPISIFQTIILIVVVFSAMKRKNVKICLLSIILFFTVLADYSSIDPVSDSIFFKKEYGNGKLYYMTFINLNCLENSRDGLKIKRTFDSVIDEREGRGGRDLSTYNRQRGYIGLVLREFLSEINYTENDVIIVPSYLDSCEDTSSFLFCRDMYVWENFIFWDNNLNMLKINNYREIEKNESGELEKLNMIITEDDSIYDDAIRIYQRVYVMDVTNMHRNNQEYTKKLNSFHKMNTKLYKKDCIGYKFVQIK